MPYDPGVVDRSGEILGQGIASGMGSLGSLLTRLAEHQDNEEKQQKFQLGLKKALKPAWQELGFKSEAEFENSDTKSVIGLAQGAITKSTLEQHQAQMLDAAQVRAQRAEQMDAGVQARGAQAQFNSRMAGFTRPQPALDLGGAAGDAGSLAPGSMAKMAQAPQGQLAEVPLGVMQQFASEANLPIADQLHLAQMQAFAGKAKAAGVGVNPTFDQDPVSGNRFYRLGKMAMPSGVDPATIGIPDETGLDPGTYVDRKGKPFTVYDRTNPARDKKAGVDAIVEGEKALRALEDDIGAWNSRAQRAAKDKNVTPPDPKLLQALQARKARLEGALGTADGGPKPGPAAGGDAEAIRAAFKAGALTKEEAVKKLKGMGFK